MNLNLLWLLLAVATPQWLSSAWAGVVGEGAATIKSCCAAHVLAPRQQDNVFVAAEAPGMGASAHAFMVDDAQDEDDVRAHVAVGVGRAQVKNANGGWLGVSIQPIPALLADQLDTDGRGMVIRNVVKDSPADKAGLLAHDVILLVDGNDVGGDLGGFVETLSSHKPGDTVTLTFLRKAQEQTAQIVLGSRADNESWQWKEQLSAGEIAESVHTRGRLLHRDHSGNWVFKNLANLHSIPGLPSKISQMILPDSGNRTVFVDVRNGHKQIRTKIKEDDGSTLEIKQQDEGDIVVTRTDPDGNETTDTYPDEDALRDADEQAYDTLKRTGKSMLLKLELDGTAGPHGFDCDFNFDFDSDAWKQQMDELHTNLNKMKEGYHATVEQSLAQLREMMENLSAGNGLGEGNPNPSSSEPIGKPRQSFEVRPDGTIQVRIRKGDSELVHIYKDEADLQQRRPDIYEKYLDILSAEEESVVPEE